MKHTQVFLIDADTGNGHTVLRKSPNGLLTEKCFWNYLLSTRMLPIKRMLNVLLFLVMLSFIISHSIVVYNEFCMNSLINMR